MSPEAADADALGDGGGGGEGIYMSPAKVDSAKIKISTSDKARCLSVFMVFSPQREGYRWQGLGLSFATIDPEGNILTPGRVTYTVRPRGDAKSFASQR